MRLFCIRVCLVAALLGMASASHSETGDGGSTWPTEAVRPRQVGARSASDRGTASRSHKLVQTRRVRLAPAATPATRVARSKLVQTRRVSEPKPVTRVATKRKPTIRAALKLGHVLVGGDVLGEVPGQHELRLEHGAVVRHDSIKRRPHPIELGVADEALHRPDAVPGLALEPAPVSSSVAPLPVPAGAQPQPGALGHGGSPRHPENRREQAAAMGFAIAAFVIVNRCCAARAPTEKGREFLTDPRACSDSGFSFEIDCDSSFGWTDLF